MSTASLLPAPEPAIRPEPPAIIPPLPVRRFTVDEYHRMIQAGILDEDDNVELLEGWIVPKMPKNPPHDTTISIVAEDSLMPRLPEGYHCRTQSVVTTTYSELEPDISVVRGLKRMFLARHPGPADLALVAEVAESSLSADRTVKTRIFARAAVPVYWIINLVDRQVEVYTAPSGPIDEPLYRTRKDYRAGDLVPFVIDGRELGPIPAEELLP